MQNYLLTFCEKLVLHEFSQQRALHPVPERMYYMRVLAALHAEKEQAIAGFHRLVFDLKGEGKIQRAIRGYQEKIVMLADHITIGMKNEDILRAGELDEQEPSWTAVCKSTLRTLLELLYQVEDKFSRYIELEGRIPMAYIVFARHKFDTRLTVLTSALGVAGVSSQLKEFIRLPFLEFLCEDEGRIITYQRLHYLNALMIELCKIMPVSANMEDIDGCIQEKLWELNFNHRNFFIYCTTCIKEQVKGFQPKERLEHLIWLLKEVNQIQHKHGMVYNPLDENLKRQLHLWLTEEINYMKDVGLIPAPLSGSSARWKDFKVETQFSVAQMAYCIKLLCDTGMFTNPNKSELLEFFTEFFSTVKQPRISYGSLRKNFYNDNASAAAGVREILITLLNHSKKGFSSWMIGIVSLCDFIFYLSCVNQ